MNIFDKIKIENIKEIILKKENGRFDKIIFEMPNISLDKINCAYVGKVNCCMCGCSGKYSYSNLNRKYSSKERGYEVSNDEINEDEIEFILDKLKGNAHKGIEVIEDYIYAFETNTKTYVLYLKK